MTSRTCHGVRTSETDLDHTPGVHESNLRYRQHTTKIDSRRARAARDIVTTHTQHIKNAWLKVSLDCSDDRWVPQHEQSVACAVLS